MKDVSAKSWLLIIGQFACIAYILLTGPLLARHPGWLALEMAGALLGIWAYVSIPFKQLRIAPEVSASAKLIKRGPYRWIRHPMYAAVLLAALALVLDTPSLWRWLGWIGLVIVLGLKAVHEERLLAKTFPEYPDYQRQTKRFLPYLW
jgi:protein-S-isoprenylcysteine O-methyltransferase Ste14